MVGDGLFAFGPPFLTFLPLDDLEETVEQLGADGTPAFVGGCIRDGHADKPSCVVCTLGGVRREELPVHRIDDLFERDGTIVGPGLLGSLGGATG